jgi:fructose-1,6-bisphosphatase/inositol monophosphatase family enzyme
VKEYLEFAKEMALLGGEIIEVNSGKMSGIAHKADSTPVTDIDKNINHLIIEAVRRRFPEHGVIGEESSHGNGQEEMQWVVDPLDGTGAAICEIPTSSCVIGLMQAGQMKLAAIGYPFLKQLFYAVEGQGAYCNEARIRVNGHQLAEPGYVLVSESSFHFAQPIKAAGGRIEISPGAAFRATRVALGRCVANIQGVAGIEDVGPASLIVEEAGGKATDLQGNRIIWDAGRKPGVILSNGIVHDQLIEIAQD